MVSLEILLVSDFEVTILQTAVANVLDCNIIESRFKLQLCYHIHFQTNTLGKGMNPLIPLCWTATS